MVKLADTQDLGSCTARCAGSTPASPTISKHKLMQAMLRLFTGALFFLAACSPAPKVPPENRPAHWAQPVADARLKNFHQVTPELLRSSFPDGSRDVADLQTAGIATVINLRAHNDSEEEILRGGFTTHRYKMNAGSVTEDDLHNVLRLILDSPKPVLIHCWHGADRTGFIIAGYRIVVQNWDKDEAIREMRLGGFNFHERPYANIPATLQSLDVPALRARLGLK